MSYDLPRYRSHKLVHAAPIAAMSEPSGSESFVTVMLNGEATKLQVPPDFFARGRPSQGDYVVIYRDGYMSWSPRKEFEDGYKLDEPSAAARQAGPEAAY